MAISFLVTLQLNNISYEISPGFDPSLAEHQRASCVITAFMRSSGQNEKVLMLSFPKAGKLSRFCVSQWLKTYLFFYFVPWNRPKTDVAVVSSSASYSISNLTPQTYPVFYCLSPSPSLLANTDHLPSNTGKTHFLPRPS